MAIRLDSHVFAGNPLLSAKNVPSPGVLLSDSAFQALKSIFLAEQLEDGNTAVKVLAFRRGRPLTLSLDPVGGSSSAWRLCWMPPSRFNEVSVDSFVYLGSSEAEDVAYWAVDISDRTGPLLGNGGNGLCFVELRTLMVAADWTDADSMGELSIAGHARALLEWHKVSRFCGHCGSNTAPTDSGRRKQCTNESCKKKIYPRIDPVVIMLVIDKENDRALLSRQSRFVPRMWSCLAGFIEPGESLEEAVRRETWEETGIEVGQVVYHSSQPWPVGPNSMPCQLMVGFFAYAKSLEIRVDKSELEDAQWHSREDVKTALTLAHYEKAQRAAAFKVNQMCKGVEKGQSLSSDFNVEGGELVPMFIPGPFAIAHHLIASWAHGTATAEPGEAPKAFSSASSL
ncbi:hypothetical protein HPP92_000609 [Vanilla planifolia]|uniref:NAD(+) diphosphatase n=1 Tax=Vanilla planifolia TaxID=51239 RepID=A0A835RQC8_VANPL|nr:hypothetical protein HPP92_000685 [Vanilla planifolia]KAG0500537.1 hypothetical protein HPP92_000609 [Vanilla planifolia]